MQHTTTQLEYIPADPQLSYISGDGFIKAIQLDQYQWNGTDYVQYLAAEEYQITNGHAAYYKVLIKAPPATEMQAYDFYVAVLQDYYYDINKPTEIHARTILGFQPLTSDTTIETVSEWTHTGDHTEDFERGVLIYAFNKGSTPLATFNHYDSDDDGTPDTQDPDDDGDGTPDGQDPDDDGDGTPDGQEPGRDSDHDGTPDTSDNDDDNDGVSDSWDYDVPFPGSLFFTEPDRYNPAWEAGFENAVTTLAIIPGLNVVANGFALIIDTGQFIGSLAASITTGKWGETLDEAGDIVGDLTGIFVPAVGKSVGKGIVNDIKSWF
ncbi:hypothetical protein MycrhDRAFT_6684 [Mycolicibacterium rhodesiae JS60]|nr:hypothetical protein MycrhDRAFT_6684 [Mycolicibacterium rhodesiae JS60]